MSNYFGFLLFNDFEDMDLAGPFEMIGIWSKQFKGPAPLITISESGGLVKSTHGLSLQTDTNFNNCPKLDYLLVPGGMGTRKEVDNPRIIEFIRKTSSSCQHILSVCTGSFLLQAAGLLHNKKATTHWASLDRLRAIKDVNVINERFTRDGNTWTSAGISAGTDLALAFIAAMAGDDIAGKVQLAAEYYPTPKIYGTDNLSLPNYVKDISIL